MSKADIRQFTSSYCIQLFVNQFNEDIENNKVSTNRLADKIIRFWLDAICSRALETEIINEDQYSGLTFAESPLKAARALKNICSKTNPPFQPGNRIVIETCNSFTHFAELLNETILDNEKEHAKDRLFLRTILSAFELSAIAMFELDHHNPNLLSPVSWENFDPLYGDYPSIKYIHSNPRARGFEHVITEARKIWEKADNRVQDDSIHEEAINLRCIYHKIHTDAVENIQGWRLTSNGRPSQPSFNFSPENSEEILEFLKNNKDLCVSLEIDDTEILSLFSILEAIKGLDILCNAEVWEQKPDLNEIDLYLHNAEGFLIKAKDLLSLKEQKNAVKRETSEQKSEAAKSRHKWRKPTLKYIEDLLKEAGPQASFREFTSKNLQSIMKKRANCGYGEWTSETAAVDWISREVAKLHGDLFPDKQTIK